MSERPVVRHEVSEKIDANIRFVWDLLANTEHLNRTIGLPPVSYSSAVVDESGLYRIAEASRGPITLKWKEFPFDWIRPYQYSVFRQFLKGPFDHMTGGIKLKEDSTGCIVTVFGEIKAKGMFSKIAAKKIVGDGIRNTVKYVKEATKLVKDGVIDPKPRNRTRTPTDEAVLDEKIAQVKHADPNIVSAVRRYLVEATDEEVLAIKPVLFARHMNEDPITVAKTFLLMVQAGILSLDWKLLCPNCRVPKASCTTLSEIPTTIHCDLCGIRYDVTLEKTIEMCFRIHPSLRRAVDRRYCIGGPYATPHAIVQVGLNAGEERVIEFSPEFQELRIRALKSNVSCTPQMDKDEVRAIFSGTSWEMEQTSSGRKGNFKYTLVNKSSSRITVVVEDRDIGRDSLTLAKALSIQEFRDLFARELLAPGVSVSVETCAIMFTDLTDSTVMYEKTGDAAAYVAVRKHFDLLKEIIAKNRGAIVKTIGDAVMAVFIREADCLKAALDICARRNEFATIFDRVNPNVVKVGIHSGRAVTVNANDKMDYFGRTVNIAARVQGLSIGGDVVMTDVFTKLTECEKVLEEYSFDKDIFGSHLKGIENVFQLIRIRNARRKWTT